MVTKNELFLLAKVNILENVTAQLLVMGAMFGKKFVPDLLDRFEHNLRLNCQQRAAVLEGTGDGALEMQTEMLKQLDYFFAIVSHYRENMTPKS